MDAESLCVICGRFYLCTGTTVSRDSSDEINTLLQGTSGLGG